MTHTGGVTKVRQTHSVTGASVSPCGVLKTPSNKAPLRQNRNYVAKIQIVEPVLANVTNSTVTGVQPAPTLAYVPRSYHEFILPEWSAVLDRQNISKMSPLILQNAQIKAVLENLAFSGV